MFKVQRANLQMNETFWLFYWLQYNAWLYLVELEQNNFKTHFKDWNQSANQTNENNRSQLIKEIMPPYHSTVQQGRDRSVTIYSHKIINQNE